MTNYPKSLGAFFRNINKEILTHEQILKDMNLKISVLCDARKAFYHNLTMREKAENGAENGLEIFVNMNQKAIIDALILEQNYDILKNIVYYLPQVDRVKLFDVKHTKLIRELVPYMTKPVREKFVFHISREVRKAVAAHCTDSERDQLVCDASADVKDAVYQHGNASHRQALGSFMLSDRQNQERLRLVIAHAEDQRDVAKAKMLIGDL